MKSFNWNNEKNELLKKTRHISFENVVYALEQGALLDIIENPNEEKYRGQYVLVVDIDGYVHMVPFVENDSEIFLKTIIPSRKMTKLYLGEE